MTDSSKIKEIIRNLQTARGNGANLISLVIPPKDKIARVTKMLADEIEIMENRPSSSLLEVLLSAQEQVKTYTQVPPNGLVIYCGKIITERGNEEEVHIDFEPFKPLHTSLYLCDNQFHTGIIEDLLESDC